MPICFGRLPLMVLLADAENCLVGKTFRDSYLVLPTWQEAWPEPVV
jgi:hypothetical protein